MVLAHAGGVDEAAVIVVPLVVFAAFLLAERRVRRREQAAQDAVGESDQQPVQERNPEETA